MQAFENKLAELINSKKRKKKPEIDKEIILLLKDQIQKAPEFENFLSIAEKQLKNQPNLLSTAIVSGLAEISEDKKKELMEPLKSRYQKPMIYQIIDGLLTQDSSVQMGMELFSFCCDKTADIWGEKSWQDMIKKMKNALKDNSFKLLLEKELSKNSVICLLHLIFNQNPDECRSLSICEKAILKASKIWEGLSHEDRTNYANCIKPLFKGKVIDDLLINKESKNAVSPEFMKAVSLSDKENLSAKKDDTHPLPSEKDEVKQVFPSEEKKVAKPESVSNKKEPHASSSQKQAKPSFDPVQAMDDIVVWLKECPMLQAQELFKWVEKKDDAIRGYRETEGELKREIGSLKADNRDLDNKVKELVNLREQNRNEIDTLKEKIETDKQFYQERMKTFGRESEEREERLISEMKNRMASRLQPLIDQFNSLKHGNDLNPREKGLVSNFDTMVSTLKHLLDIQVKS
jgi:hypothetical protein